MCWGGGGVLQAYFPGRQSSTDSSNRKEGEKVLYHIIYRAGIAKAVMASYTPLSHSFDSG